MKNEETLEIIVNDFIKRGYFPTFFYDVKGNKIDQGKPLKSKRIYIKKKISIQTDWEFRERCKILVQSSEKILERKK